MSPLARSAAFALGAVLVVAGTALCQFNGAGTGLVLLGGLVILSVLAERRYRGAGSAFAMEEKGKHSVSHSGRLRVVRGAFQRHPGLGLDDMILNQVIKPQARAALERC